MLSPALSMSRLKAGSGRLEKEAANKLPHMAWDGRWTVKFTAARRREEADGLGSPVDSAIPACGDRDHSGIDRRFHRCFGFIGTVMATNAAVQRGTREELVAEISAAYLWRRPQHRSDRASRGLHRKLARDPAERQQGDLPGRVLCLEGIGLDTRPGLALARGRGRLMALSAIDRPAPGGAGSTEAP